MSDKDGGPAFAGHASGPDGRLSVYHTGMSLRDWFAGMAIQGMLTNQKATVAKVENGRSVVIFSKENIASAYDCADLMLQERDK